MKLAFDTSVLVAALVELHPHHLRTRPWIKAVTSGKADSQMTWHAAAETWSVLTRLPGTLRIAPATADLVLQRALEKLGPVEISANEYQAALRRCAERGLRSGALFDALHLISAEAHEADALVTFNASDFVRLEGQDSPEILVPPDPPAFPG